MASEKPLSRRVDFFYLVDSILNKCARDTHRGRGDGTKPMFDHATVQRHSSGFPVLVAAGLPQAVSGLLEVPEGPEKLLKVLGLWKSNSLLAESVVDPVMARVTAFVAQREEGERAKQQEVLRKQQQAAEVETARKVTGVVDVVEWGACMMLCSRTMCIHHSTACSRGGSCSGGGSKRRTTEQDGSSGSSTWI